ncbi:asparagine--tRNA ligase, partial [Exiguobacterium sp. IPBC4]|uniref:amino acid--tRNA ligase-related protein n=2 Tax=Bacillales TaxID=1385 RepID=UPI0010D2DB6A
TTMDMNNVPKTDEGDVDFSKDFFNGEANLTVSGQLSAEAFALAFQKVYTFGPTFRAENSNTTRHAAEFWMVEPEVAFAELPDILDLAEAMIKHVIQYVLNEAPEEITFFNSFIDKTLIERLNTALNTEYAR